MPLSDMAGSALVAALSVDRSGCELFEIAMPYNAMVHSIQFSCYSSTKTEKASRAAAAASGVTGSKAHLPCTDLQ